MNRRRARTVQVLLEFPWVLWVVQALGPTEAHRPLGSDPTRTLEAPQPSRPEGSRSTRGRARRIRTHQRANTLATPHSSSCPCTLDRPTLSEFHRSERRANCPRRDQRRNRSTDRPRSEGNARSRRDKPLRSDARTRYCPHTEPNTVGTQRREHRSGTCRRPLRTELPRPTLRGYTRHTRASRWTKQRTAQ